MSKTTRNRSAAIPREVIRLTDHAQLELYLTKFARGELGLVLLLGRHGTGKSESVKRALSVPANIDESISKGALYVEGHVQPFGLYRELWEYGHSHHSLPDDPHARSMDVGVDATAVRLGRPDVYGTGTIPADGLRPEDYRPIHFDEVAELMRLKSFRPVDHHDE